MRKFRWGPAQHAFIEKEEKFLIRVIMCSTMSRLLLMFIRNTTLCMLCTKETKLLLLIIMPKNSTYLYNLVYTNPISLMIWLICVRLEKIVRSKTCSHRVISRFIYILIIIIICLFVCVSCWNGVSVVYDTELVTDYQPSRVSYCGLIISKASVLRFRDYWRK